MSEKTDDALGVGKGKILNDRGFRFKSRRFAVSANDSECAQSLRRNDNEVWRGDK